MPWGARAFAMPAERHTAAVAAVSANVEAREADAGGGELGGRTAGSEYPA